jgi:hypothetical protein
MNKNLIIIEKILVFLNTPYPTLYKLLCDLIQFQDFAIVLLTNFLFNIKTYLTYKYIILDIKKNHLLIFF